MLLGIWFYFMFSVYFSVDHILGQLDCREIEFNENF